MGSISRTEVKINMAGYGEVQEISTNFAIPMFHTKFHIICLQTHEIKTQISEITKNLKTAIFVKRKHTSTLFTPECTVVVTSD